MIQLKIEWKHIEINKKTCIRCSKTGKSLIKVVKRLKRELKPKGIKVTFIETKLPRHKIANSNIILFNNVPIEDVLSEAKVSKNCCRSCCDFTGKKTYCRIIKYKDRVYEEIPESLIYKAALNSIRTN